MSSNPAILDAREEVLSTLKKDGSRKWMYPRLAKGRFLTARRWVAYGLIALFTLLPFLRINGKPAILLDIVARRFTLFGVTFLPTDTVLLALLLVSIILLVFLMTALLGRVWCGWACPQTVYMEFVYRPIERLCLGKAGVGGTPGKQVAPWRYAIMYAAFAVVALWLANTFLAYFVGVEQLRHWVSGSPADHWASFLVMAVVTAAMMFDFSFFREQTCLIACPYGRLQSVLLDRNSLIITYDTKRGEPRGKKKRDAHAPEPQTVSLRVLPNEAAAPASTKTGDCIDCNLCVAVCPTGIDIRNGLQFECVGCAQCIDVCDEVMEKIDRPKGLIRYGSQAGMAGAGAKLIRPRVIIYPALLVAVLGLLTFLLLTRSPADVTLLRGYGKPFVMTPTGEVENVMKVKITNRTDQPQQYHIAVPDSPAVRAVPTQEWISVEAGQSYVEPVQVFAPPAAFKLGAMDVSMRVTSKAGFAKDIPCRLLGPAGVNTTQP